MFLLCFDWMTKNANDKKMKGCSILQLIFQVTLRTLLSFFSLLILVRLMGKQQVSQLTFFDYVTGITIGSIAANLSVQTNDSWMATLTGMIIWAILSIFIGYLTVKNVWVNKVVDGEATIVIQNGKILENNLRRIRIPIDELLSELRSQGVFHIEDVEFALIEPSGKLSIQKVSQKQALTPNDLGVSTQYDGLPTDLVVDGVVLKDALKSLHLTQSWLFHQLSRENIKEIKEISLAQLDTQGNLYVDLKTDAAYFLIPTK
jgi:uncharacterized membrane protein YcaP (DUF421 family)